MGESLVGDRRAGTLKIGIPQNSSQPGTAEQYSNRYNTNVRDYNSGLKPVNIKHISTLLP